MKTSPLGVTSTVFTAVVIVAAAAATATADQVGEAEVNVSVDVAEITDPGVLAMTVGPGGAVLTEQGSDDLTRQFVGVLPPVTVTDTRAPEDVPEGVGWYVMGTATDFVGGEGQDPIPARNLGWEPEMVAEEGSGLVFAGQPVDSAEDGGRGLVDQELLVGAFDSQAVAPEGEWTATAELTLRTAATVAPGSYASTLTLSLFE